MTLEVDVPITQETLVNQIKSLMVESGYGREQMDLYNDQEFQDKVYSLADGADEAREVAKKLGYERTVASLTEAIDELNGIRDRYKFEGERLKTDDYDFAGALADAQRMFQDALAFAEEEA